MGRLRERLLNRFGPDAQELSLLWDENTVTTLLAFLSPAQVLEIGTHRGGSSSLFARCGSRVTTICESTPKFDPSSAANRPAGRVKVPCRAWIA